jgi:hypothetical protein
LITLIPLHNNSNVLIMLIIPQYDIPFGHLSQSSCRPHQPSHRRLPSDEPDYDEMEPTHRTSNNDSHRTSNNDSHRTSNNDSHRTPNNDSHRTSNNDVKRTSNSIIIDELKRTSTGNNVVDPMNNVWASSSRVVVDAALLQPRMIDGSTGNTPLLGRWSASDKSLNTSIYSGKS